MKIVALNGSPTKRGSGTVKIMDCFLEGAEKAGAEVTRFDVAHMRINPCMGCMACWFQTPGVCVQKDEMSKVIDELKVADVVVMATPVYVDGMTAQLKKTLDRHLQLVHPEFEIRDGHCRHPKRDKLEGGKMVLISVAGFHEIDNFDPLVSHFNAISRNMDREVAGVILRPYAKLLPMMKMRGVKVDYIYDHVRKAGRELVMDGKVSEETELAIQEQVVTQDELIENINSAFKMFKQTGRVQGFVRNLFS